MKTKILIVSLGIVVPLEAGTIVGNAGFTVYEDITSWNAAHLNATPVTLFGGVAGGTTYSSPDLSAQGYGISLGTFGDNQALMADPTTGVALRIEPVATSVHGFAFYFTPVPGGTYEHIVVYGTAGEDLDYYANTGGSFFLGVATSDTIAQVTLLTPYGGTTTAQAIAVYGIQQDQGAQTPEPGTRAMAAIASTLVLARHRAWRKS